MDNGTRWYLPDKDKDPEIDERDRANHLITETGAIETRQSSWHALNLWNATLFANRELPGFRWGAVDAEEELWPTSLRTENIIEEIGESMLAKASSSPLKPALVPRGLSLEVERAVHMLDEFVFSLWRQTRSEEACIKMFLDAYIAGLGCAKVAFENKRVHVESVFFDNIIIDNRECANRSKPRTYRIRQVLPRATVEARYGVELGEVDRTKAYVPHREVADGWVVVTEAWRLPVKNKGGYHAVACNGKLLVQEAYTYDWVPLVFFHWSDVVNGFFGKSGVEQLVPFQNRQNELNDAIEAAIDLVCRPRILLNANTMVDINQWDNEAGRFLLWSGIEPKPFEWHFNALADLFRERVQNKQSAYSHMAISEWFANADKPEGVRYDSSAAVREGRNMEDSRHLRLWTRFEQARLDLARTILLVLSVSKGADDFVAVHQPSDSRVGAEDIPWAAVKDLTENQYAWSLEAVPLSSTTPAARRELIRDWSSRGLIDDEEARRMESNPNLERDEALETASDDDITRHLAILMKGEFEAPTELTNTTLGIKRVTANYHRLRVYNDVKKDVLENHIKWIVVAATIQAQAITPPQPTPFAPTQGMPGTSAASAPPINNVLPVAVPNAA